MTIKKRKSGLTVVELLVVIGIIAVVVAISLPAFNAMQKSFDSTGAEGMISAALSIVFSPAGKLVIHELRCARKNSKDDIFNTQILVENDPPTGMFIEDDY